MSNTSFRRRDQQIIDLVIRYRLITNRVLGSSLLTGRSQNAVAKVTARMCACKLLNRYVLIPPEYYFRLGVAAINALGIPLRNSESLGPQSLPIEFATLLYATQTNAQRRRLTKMELAEYMPWLPSDLSQSPYCLDAQGKLILVIVDLGGSPQHVARKVTSAAYGRLALPQISDLAAQSRFQIAVLTTSDEKAKAINKALLNSECSNAVHVRLVVIPRLSFLLLRLS